MTQRGPMEGRPPGELFAHQRWDEFFPKVGYIMSLGEIGRNSLPSQPAVADPNSVWTYGTGNVSPRHACRRRCSRAATASRS